MGEGTTVENGQGGAMGNERKTEVFGETVINNGQQHADLMRMPDPDDGTPVTVARVNDGSTLERWRKRGLIDDLMYQGGTLYHRDWYASRIGPVIAKQVLERVQATPSDHDWQAVARSRFADVENKLTPSQSHIAWYVLGEELSLREYAQRQKSGGKVMDRQKAGGILHSALEALVDIYQLNARRK